MRGVRSEARSLTAKEDIDDAYARARSAARTAIELSPELSEAHSAFAFMLLTADLDLSGAEVEFRKAIALSPNDAQTVHGLGYLLAAQGRLAEAEAMSRRAMELDPKRLGPYQNLARIQIGTDRLDEAEATLREALQIQPDASHAYTYLTLIDLRRNDAAAALRDAALEPEGFWHDFAVTLALQAQPDRAAADRALNALIEKDSEGGPFQIAIVYALRKEPDKIFEWLDRAYASRDSGLTQLLVESFLLDYRDDPRFTALAMKLKIDPAMLDHSK